MKNTYSIAAQLDLTQSLSTFETLVHNLLRLDEIGAWDGAMLMERESQIRAGALVLAGQCIALLISMLSEHSASAVVSRDKTQGIRTAQSESKGRRQITITTLGNVSVPLKLSYVVKGQDQGIAGRRSHEWIAGGFYPFLEWLGMGERVSPLVWSTVAEYGMVSASFASAQQLLKTWGIRLSNRRVKRLTYRFGEIGIAQRTTAVEQLSQGTLAPGRALTHQRVVISVDGGRTRLRRNKRGKRRQATRRHGFHGDWREPLLLTIYAVDEQGYKINTREIPITNDGTFGHHEALLQLLEMHLVKLGIATCQRVLLLADGARWMWKHIPPLLQRLGVPAAKISQLIDFYHAVEHLHAFAQWAFDSSASQARWVGKSRSLLKRGHFKTLLSRMKALLATAEGQQRHEMDKALAYFSEHPERFGYKRIAALNLPIGSGSIESLVRQVVNLRLKGNGKFWLQAHAEIMLHGRCHWAAGTWQQFSHAVLTAALS